uniref:Uncharacterized protein n=1 Tax=Ditylenchus dipsaci TaxID=166011 RepID=A0A915DJG8_9BILA
MQGNLMELLFKKSLKALKDKDLMAVMTTLLVDYLISQAPILLSKKMRTSEAKYLWDLSDAIVNYVSDKNKGVSTGASMKTLKKIAGDSLDTIKGSCPFCLGSRTCRCGGSSLLAQPLSWCCRTLKDAPFVQNEDMSNAVKMGEVSEHDVEMPKNTADAGKAGEHSYCEGDLMELLFKKSLKALKDKDLMAVMTTLLVDYLISQAPILLSKKMRTSEAKYYLSDAIVNYVSDKNKGVSTGASMKTLKKIAGDSLDASKYSVVYAPEDDLVVTKALSSINDYLASAAGKSENAGVVQNDESAAVKMGKVGEDDVEKPMDDRRKRVASSDSDAPSKKLKESGGKLGWVSIKSVARSLTNSLNDSVQSSGREKFAKAVEKNHIKAIRDFTRAQLMFLEEKRKHSSTDVQLAERCSAKSKDLMVVYQQEKSAIMEALRTEVLNQELLDNHIKEPSASRIRQSDFRIGPSCCCRSARVPLSAQRVGGEYLGKSFKDDSKKIDESKEVNTSERKDLTSVCMMQDKAIDIINPGVKQRMQKVSHIPLDNRRRLVVRRFYENEHTWLEILKSDAFFVDRILLGH